MLDADTLNSLYRYSLTLSQQPDDAYDLLQSAIEKYLQQDTSKIHNPRAYLKTTIRNGFIDSYRKHRNIKLEPFETLDEHHTLAIDTRSLEDCFIEAEFFQSCWQALSAGEREILFLWAVEGCTAQEIAEQTQSPRGTVLSKIHRIKKKLYQHQAGEHQAINDAHKG